MKPIPLRLEVTTYAPGAEVEVRSITAEQLKSVDVQSFDYLLAPFRGIYAYRTASGEWIEHLLDASGLGKTGLDIVRAVQLNPGVLLRPADIASLVGNEHLRYHNPLAARLRAIRAAHGESGDHQRLFISQRNGGYGLKWPSEFSWIWIDRI